MLSRILANRIPAFDYEADKIYEDHLSDSIFRGCLTNDELVKKLGLPMNFDEEIAKVLRQLQYKKKYLYEYREMPQQREDCREEIAGLKEHINFFNSERNKFFVFSAEYIATTARQQFLSEKYDQEYQDRLTEEEVRAIARSYEWFSLYEAGYRPEVFTPDIIDIIGWTKRYANIRQHPDCPEDYVIEDDDMLDGWIQYINKKKDVKEPEGQEVFIPAKSPQQIKEIQDKNPIETKVMLKQRQKKMEEGPVEEKDLPDRKGIIKF